ncbi:MAG: ribonuclease HII [Candidatus Bathyarchaeia archaeon]
MESVRRQIRSGIGGRRARQNSWRLTADDSSSRTGRGWEKAVFRFPKGPLIGPLVVAGLLFDERGLSKLEELGVRDSKLLTRRSRRSLSTRIVSIAEAYAIFEIQPQEIDSVVLRGRPMARLNRLEAKIAAKIIDRLRPEIAYVDAPDRSPERFACQILEGLKTPTRIVSEHHADRKYPVVSAASILAKVKRDEVIDELHKSYGDFGSGYPSDPKTTGFVKEWILRDGCNLPIVRRTWRTFRRLQRELTEG